jgi:hypothetical protein
MGDKYWGKHQKKNPKRTPEQIREDKIKRRELKISIKD